MSISAPWIRADDGLYYKDPTFRGTFEGRRWFVCFDDFDDDELVVEALPSADAAGDFLPYVKRLLKHLGIEATVSHEQSCGRVFGTRVLDARFVRLHPRKPYPARLLMEAGHVGKERPQ